MSEQLTIELNGKEYALNGEMRERIEQRAESEFAENWMLTYYWTENERGDPILAIETEGPMVPWDRLERLNFEMEEVEQEEDDDSDSGETKDLDNGNGVKSVPKDDVDISTPDADPNSEKGEEEEEPPDTKFIVTHPSEHYVPQPDDDDPEKLPPDPEELPNDPTLVTWIPDDGREEVWSTGKALVSTSSFIEWNVQLRADEVPDGAMEITPGPDNHVQRVPKTHNHDEWERMVKMADCDVVAEKKPSDEPPTEPTEEQQRGYSGKEADSDVGGIAGGTNWDYGNR